jgi:hypothetical protein
MTMLRLRERGETEAQRYTMTAKEQGDVRQHARRYHSILARYTLLLRSSIMSIIRAQSCYNFVITHNSLSARYQVE